MKEVLVVLQGVIVFSVIVFGVFWLTKKLARVAPGCSRSGYMEIVDRLPVSQDKCLEIVKIGNRFYVISVEPSGISLLKELESDQLEKTDGTGKGEDSLPQQSFGSIFSRIRQRGEKNG